MLFTKIKILILLIFPISAIAHTNKDRQNGKDQQKEPEYNPLGALVRCNMLPLEFISCEDLKDHKGNKTAQEEAGHGCLKFGGIWWQDVERAKKECTVLQDIECHGPRSFKRDGFPCIKHSDHYFLTTLLYSILLGFLGMDRFSLNQTGVAVMKLLSLGGLGLWWIIDILFLATYNLSPEDNWNQYV
ncbi:hypothetical protein PVAND_000263 [Polypedilum vanderplanki]|uniref:TM2 domain-containing protein n=1 Tax=Polypedilum vanderplanki TaxID=319348 RepID=A0A9J6BKT1_POLVA|nr:hypothetical protein PVAND_000263 [Polypedilum vanderplanki]